MSQNFCNSYIKRTRGAWVADTSRNFSKLFQGIEIKFSPLLSLAASNFAKFSTQKMTKQTINNSPEKTTVIDEASTNSLPSKEIGHSPTYLTTFPECSVTFPGMFGYISRNVWQHSPEYLATFPVMFGDIPGNITFHHSPCSPFLYS